MKTSIAIVLSLFFIIMGAFQITGCNKPETAKPAQESVEVPFPEEPAPIPDELAPIPGEQKKE